MSDDKHKMKNMRVEYGGAALDRSSVHADPRVQFKLWFDEATAADPDLANAAVLSTCVGKRPSSRVILVKGVDTGFVFYTHYASRKGTELTSNPHASLVFHWRETHRQVRIEGLCKRLSRDESTTYFHSRPRGSQLSGAASPQSQPIANREALEKLRDALADRADKTIPCPEEWGGYRLLPDYFEFWQGRSDRLHDRIVYRKHGDNWQTLRLAP